MRENANFGYDATSREQDLRTLLGLHPDVLAWDQLTVYMDGELRNLQTWKRQLELAQTMHRPATSGWNVNIKAGEEEASKRYGPLLEEFDWTYPDGTALESPRGILAETFHGDPYQIEFTFNTLGTPSVFGPGGLDLTVRATETQLERGYAGFFVDGVGVFRLQGLDFSRWAQAAFREHLASLSAERRAELGVEDPTSFEIRAYLEENGLTPNDGTDPRSDPLFREYLLHHHEGIDAWYDDYRAAVTERFPDRMANDAIALYANQFTGHLSHPQAANVYISDSFDVIYTELFPRANPAVDVNYKTMRSVGNFEKPVVAKGTLAPLPDDQLGDIDSKSPNPNLLRFQAAEAYANGARLQLPLTARAGYPESDAVTNWVGPDGTVPDELQAFVDFLWAHERFLTDLAPAGDVAVIWSLPTRVWNHEPAWDIEGEEGARIDSFIGASSLLREAGLTYEVLTFGHPRLWDDSTQLERLTNYDAIVLPAVQCLSDTQLSALAAYVQDGGAVISSGPLPDRDTAYERRDDVADQLAGDGVTVLDHDPGRRYERRGTTDGTLIGALADTGITPTRTDDDRAVAVNAHTQTDPDRTVLAVVNYDYDAETDTFSPKSDVELRLPNTFNKTPFARYYSPHTTTELSVETSEDGRTVTVPEVIEWGLLVLSSDEDAFVAGDTETAQNRIQEATEQVTTARDTNGESADDVVLAEVQVAAAETALEYGAFTKATEAAEEALAVVEPLLPTPTPTRTSTSDTDSSESDDTDSSKTSGTTVNQTRTTSPGFSILTGIVAFATLVSRLLWGADDT